MPSPAHPPDECAAQRSQVRSLCDESVRAHEIHERAKDRARATRRESVAALQRHDTAVLAADPRRRIEEKAQARALYERARDQASTDGERMAATAAWARAVDNANRSARLAQRTLVKARKERAAAEEAGRDHDREEQVSRLGAEGAEEACLEARVRLAAREEQGQARAQQAAPGTPYPDAQRSTMHGVTSGLPLVIEALVEDDRQALEMVASHLADRTALTPAQALLYLQEFIHAVKSAAGERGFLIFDAQSSFWAHLSVSEAGDVVAALTRLGFKFEPGEGWHAGRAPAARDLTMALAYAGLDARGMRDLPSDQDLRDLPRSIGVDARAFLAADAPALTLDNVVRVLDHRAETLSPLWDAWGQIRPILLSERQTLKSLPGR
jgi:hypothetical protein